MGLMQKRVIIQEIENHLAHELSQLISNESKPGRPKNSGRMDEIKRQLLMYRYLPVRDFGSEDVVCPSALVELQLGETRSFCFIVPQGGGLVMMIEGKPLQVVTPQSPLGEALLGKKQGDRVEVSLANGLRVYQIVQIY